MSQSPVGKITPENTLKYRQGWMALNRLLHEDRSFSGNERNCAFLNCGGGSFADVSSVTGFDFTDDARSLVVSDWDFDGDLDIWTTARTAPRLRLLLNDSKSNSDWISIKLVGDRKKINLDAIGARAELYISGQLIPFIKTVHAGDAFLSQNSSWLHFAFPEGSQVEKLVVRWPGGILETFDTGLTQGNKYLVSPGGRPLEWKPPINRKSLIPSQPKLAKPDPTARIVVSGRMPLPPIYVVENGTESEYPVTQLKGPLLINLWASWCAPCRVELKSWVGHSEDFEQAGLRLLALNSEIASKSAADKFLKSINFGFESRDTSPKTVRNLDLFQRSMLDRWTDLPVPSSFLLDKSGRVAVIYKGPVEAKQILSDLELLGMSPTEVRDASVPFAGRWSFPPASGNPLLVNSQFVSANEYNEGVVYLKRYATLAQDTGQLSQKGLGDVHYVIGVIERNNGNLQGAEETLVKAQQFSPDDFRIQRDLAELFIETRQFGNASEQVSKMMSHAPQNTEAKRLQGQVLMGKANQLNEAGEAAKAIPLYRSALRANNKLLSAANNLSLILSTSADPDLRNPEEAKALGQVLCRLTKNKNPEYLETYAFAHASAGDFQSALKFSKAARKLYEAANNQSKVSEIDARIRDYEETKSQPKP